MQRFLRVCAPVPRTAAESPGTQVVNSQIVHGLRVPENEIGVSGSGVPPDDDMAMAEGLGPATPGRRAAPDLCGAGVRYEVHLLCVVTAEEFVGNPHFDTVWGKLTSASVIC